MTEPIFDRITGEPYERRVTERVVYRNGQILVDVPSYVASQLDSAKYGEIVITPWVRRPTKSLRESLDKLFDNLAKKYLTRHPVENGCYPILQRNGKSIVGHLHFDPAYSNDGLILEGIIKEIDELRNYSGNNKKATITMRIETYHRVD